MKYLRRLSQPRRNLLGCVPSSLLPRTLLVWFCLASAAWSLEISLSLEEMTLVSEDVVRGTVVQVQYSTSVPRGGIFTVATIRVAERLKGGKASDASQPLTVTLPGGMDPTGRYRLSVSGVPELKPGEEVVVFCKRDTLGRRQLIGGQGKYLLQGGLANRAGGRAELAEPSEQFLSRLRKIVHDQVPTAP